MQPWQRTNVQAAARFLREHMRQGAADPVTRTIYEGLLDVLEPARRATRVQRELSASAQAAVTVQGGRERRASSERRRDERRRIDLGSPTGVDRRGGGDRRRRADRRSR